jgi:hypothetical protein
MSGNKDGTSIDSVRDFFFYAPQKFGGVERIPPAAGVERSNARWTYRWSGIHTSSTRITHSIQVSGSATCRTHNATHQIVITAASTCFGRPRAEVLLYEAELNMAMICEADEVEFFAESIACALTIFLLKQKAPHWEPGITAPMPLGRESPWAKVIRSTLMGLKAKQSRQ